MKSFVFQNGDMLKIITDFLNILDTFNMKIVFNNNHLKKCIKRKILKSVSLGLENFFGERLGEFKELLKSTGAVLSGSFIIQSILEQPCCRREYDGKYMWHGSDVDIFVPSRESEGGYSSQMIEFDKFFGSEDRYDRKWDLPPSLIRFKPTFGQPITTEFNISPDRITVYDNLSKIEHINEYDHHFNGEQWEYKRFQIIQVAVTKDKMYHYVKKNFDLDICKNIYGFENGKECVKLHRINNLLERQCFPKKFNHRTIQRLWKYKNRGFKFVPASDSFYKIMKYYNDHPEHDLLIYEVDEASTPNFYNYRDNDQDYQIFCHKKDFSCNIACPFELFGEKAPYHFHGKSNLFRPKEQMILILKNGIEATDQTPVQPKEKINKMFEEPCECLEAQESFVDLSKP